MSVQVFREEYQQQKIKCKSITRMDFFPAIWNVLHDGRIVAASGEVPGTVRVNVSIDYLRERFTDLGKVIEVTLTGCTRFAYKPFEEQEFTTGLSAIADFKPEVSSAELQDGLCKIDCVSGWLEVAAVDGSLSLDSGRAITLQELIDVANAYWKEFGERSEQAKQKKPGKK
jgi:hypothetical protein